MKMFIVCQRKLISPPPKKKSYKLTVYFFMNKLLKALFNHVFTLKNLSCVFLHAISVFDKV